MIHLLSSSIAKCIRIALSASVIVLSMDLTETLAGPIINYPDFSSVAGLKLNGTSAKVGSGLRLTNAQHNAGSVFFSTAQDVTHDFHATYTFTVSNKNSVSNNGADGLAFVIHADPRGQNAIGHDGTAVGYAEDDLGPTNDAIVKSLAVTLRTYTTNALQIHVNPAPGNTHYRADLTSLYTQVGTIPSTVTDNIINHLETVTVDYLASTHALTVRWNNASVGLDDKVLPSPLSTILGSSNGHFGFTAGTGSEWSTITFNSFTVSVVPEPSSYILASMGVLGLSIYGVRQRRTKRSVA